MSLKHPIIRVFGMTLGYAGCFWAVRLIFLTVIAYTTIRAPEHASVALQRVGEVAQANQALMIGTGALLFTALLQVMRPLTATRFKEVFNAREFRAHFAPNGLTGCVFTAVLIAGCMLGGHMSYLGIYMRFDEVALSIAGAAVFGVGLFCMAIVEEYVMREVLEHTLTQYVRPGIAAGVSCLAYLLLKRLQFDLTALQAVNIVLFNLALSMVAHNEDSYMASASLNATFLALIHVVFGLPYMGQDMPGIFLLRSSSDDGIGSLLSGGAVGPEGGLVLTVLLVIYLYLPQIRSKKIEV